jgi:hypothetical protein
MFKQRILFLVTKTTVMPTSAQRPELSRHPASFRGHSTHVFHAMVRNSAETLIVGLAFRQPAA